MALTVALTVLFFTLLISDSCSQIVSVHGLDNSKNLQKNYATSSTLDFFGIGTNPVDHCAYKMNGKCAFCEEGYQLNEANECQQLFKRCQVFGPSSICLKCFWYFELVNGSCYDPRCANQGLYNCQKCLTGFFKTSYGFCIDQYCVTYRSGYCTTCLSGYYLDRLFGMCMEEIEQPKNDQKNQTITPINPKNSSQNITGTIQVNVVGFYTHACEIYNLQIKCIKCRENYTLQDDMCIANHQPCIRFDQEEGSCQECLSQYRLVNGTCRMRSSPNCYMMKNNECIQCNPRYYLVDKSCLEVDPNCRDYDKNTGKCISCFTGNILMDSKCTKINNSTETSIFQNTHLPIVNKTKEMLDLLAYYCIRWDSQRKKCLECYSSYYPIDGVCQRISHLCKSFDKLTGKCTSCLNGYIVENGKCVPNINQNPTLYCSVISENGMKCQECRSSYFLYENLVCIRRDPSCFSFDPTTYRCNSCYRGFFLNQGYCRVIPIKIAVPFCNKYNPRDPRQCLSCITGFYLQQNRCISMNEVCMVFRRQNGECALCGEEYIVESGRCARIESIQQAAPFCLQYNQIGLCMKCQQGYQLFNYICRDLSL